MNNPQDDADQGFMTRWSRRKRQVAQEEALASQPPGHPPVLVPDMAVGTEPDNSLRDPETGEMIDEELVRSLPRPADLQAGDDLSAFMKKGVPETMRREALRAMWTADPAIRDFVSPALDYAYDYNAPGGAPGHGPLSASDLAQAQEFLKTVFSDPPPVPGEGDPDAVSNIASSDSDILPQVMPQPAQAPSVSVRLSDGAPQNLPGSDAAAQPSVDPGEVILDTKKPRNDEVAIVQRNRNEIAADPDNQENQGNTRPVSSFRRRGGGASPV